MELTQEQIKKFWSMMSGEDSGSGRKPKEAVHSEDRIPRAGNVSKWYEERGYERETPVPGTSKRWVNPAAPSVNASYSSVADASVGATVVPVGSAVQGASGRAARPELPKLSDITSLQQWQTSYGSLDAYNKYAKENGWETATGAQIEEKLRQLQGGGSKQTVPQPEDLTHKPFGDEAEIIAMSRDQVGYFQKKAAEFGERQSALQEAAKVAEAELNKEYYAVSADVSADAAQEAESDRRKMVQKAYDQIQQELALSTDLSEIYSLSPEDIFAFHKVYEAQATNSGGAGPEWQRMMDLFGYDKWRKLTSSYSQYMGLLKEQHRQEQKEKDMRDPVNVVLSNLYAPGLSVVSSFYTPIASIGQMTTNNPVYAEDERYGIKTNTGIYDMQREVQDTRSGTRKMIEGEDPTAGRKFAGTIYGGLSSAADNLARIAVGMVTGIPPLGIAGLNAFGPAYVEAADRGANGLQALLYGVTISAVEMATEKIPLERLLSGFGADTVGKIVADTLVKQPLLEIIGEEASYFGGMIADALIMGDKSENNQKLTAYMMAGYTKEEAQQLLTKDILYGAAQTAAETYISSAAMTGVSYMGGGRQSGPTETKAQDDGLNQILQQAAATPASQTVEAVKQASQQAQQQEAATQNTQQQAQEPQPVIQPQQNRPMQEQRQASESENPESRFVEEEAARQEPPVQPVRQDPAAPPAEAVPPQPEAVPIQNQQEQKSPLDIAMEATVRGEDVQPVIQQSAKIEEPATPQSQPMPENQDEAAGSYLPDGEDGKIGERRNTENAVTKSPLDVAMEATVRGEDVQPVRPQEAASVDPGIYEEYAVPEQTESVGAAPYGFDPYSRLQFETGNQRDRDWASRPVDVPKRDTNGNKVSEVVGNLYGSAVTPDRFIPIIQKVVTEGLMGAQKKTMEESVNIANQEIDKRGIAGTLRHINSVVAKGRISDNDIATAAVLYAKLANSGKPEYTDMASELVVDLGEMGRNAGRQLNLFRLFQMMTPEGQLLAIKRSVDREVARVNKRRSKKKQISVEIAPQLEADLLEVNREVSSPEMALTVAAAREVTKVVKGELLEAAQTASDLVLNLDLSDERGESYRNGGTRNGYGRNGYEWNRQGLGTERTGLSQNDLVNRTGQRIADNLSREARNANITVEERLYRELMRFANDKASLNRGDGLSANVRQDATEATQNLQALGDYYRYQPFFQNAWNAATERVRSWLDTLPPTDQRRVRMESFLSGSGIENESPVVENLDAYNPRSTLRRGAREAANMAGFRMDNRSSTGQSVRRAVTDVLTQNYANREAAARQIANLAVASMGLEGNAAENLARNITSAFYADLAERSAARVEQMFGERNMPERTRRTLEQRLEELYNLGAFSNEQYRQAAFDSLFGEGSGIDIPDSLMQEYVDAAEERRGEALHAIYAYAAANMPATFSEKWNAWRHMSMLGNLLTISRNTLSTLAFRPYVQAKRVVGTAIEKVARIEQSKRTKSVLVGKRARGLLKWASQDAMSEEATRQLESLTQTENEARSEIQELRRIFKSNALEYLRRGVSTAMQGRDTGKSTTSILKGTSLYGDLIFKRAEYRTALAAFMKARGYTAQQLQSGQVSEEVLSEGRSYAISEAMKATFNDLNQVSQFAAKRPGTGNFAGKFANFMLEGNLPYRKTPANVAVRMAEYSQANLVRGIYNAATKVRSGEMDATQAIDQISSGFIGTSAMALGAALAAMGILVGGWPDEEDQRNGIQPYSLRIGNKTYTIDFLAPANLPLFMGANLQHSLSEEDGGSVVSTLTSVLDAGMNTLEPMLELSMLSSFNDLLESAKHADEGREVYSLLAQSATSYFLQGLPTIFGNIDRAFDENRKIVYANSDDPVIRELERLAGKVFQKLPGDFFQTEYVDEFGEFQYKGNAAVRILNSLANPFYVREIRDDEVTRELDRLEKETGEKTGPTSAPRSFSYKDESGKTQEARLTGQQWTQFQKTKGELEFSILSGMFGSDAYNQLSDNGKYKAVEMAGDYAMAYAKNQLVPEYKLEPWMKETGADPEKILERAIIAESGLSETRYANAKEMGYSLEQMSAVASQVSDYLSGMDDKTDYDAYRAVLSVTDGEERYKWLEVYGLSDSRLEAMREAVGNGYTETQFIDALETASMFASAQTATSKAWSDGKELPVDKWEDAYQSYLSASSLMRNLISSQLSTKFTAYLELRNAGMDTQTFLLEVKKYSDIGEEDGDLNDATRWHKALDDDVASGLITSTQRDILLANMRYFVQIPQNADKYEELKDSGLDPDSAEYIMTLTAGLLPEYGKKTVSDVQIWEQIISSDLSGPEKTAALEGYMDDKQERKLAYAVSLGFTPSEYVDMYRVYKDTDEYGKGKKEFRIQEFMRELDVDRDLAEALLEIYDGVYGK